VVVRQAVGHLTASTVGDQEPGRPQHPEVLGDEGLGGSGLVHQFVDASGPVGDGGQQLQAKGVSQRPEEPGRSVEVGLGHPRIVTCACCNMSVGGLSTRGGGRRAQPWCSSALPGTTIVGTTGWWISDVVTDPNNT
jgi:hypothetical protein